MVGLHAQECETLADVLKRRLQKMPLDTLQKLEELSREPQTFISAVADVAAASAKKTRHRPTPVPAGTIDRRQFMTYLGLIGGLAAAGGVGYVLGVEGSEDAVATAHKQVAAKVASIESDISTEFATLVERTKTAMTHTDALSAVAADYGEHYPGLLAAYESWQVEIAQIEQAYTDMQQIQGGIQTIVQLLALVVDSNISVEVPLLGRVALANSNFSTALLAVSHLLQRLDQALGASRQLDHQLEHWAASTSDAGINQQLFRPLQTELRDEVHGVAEACENLEREVSQVLGRLRTLS